MTRDDIIRIAKEAGFTIGDGTNGRTLIIEGDGNLCVSSLMAFAELVAAAERKACIEACAEVRVIVAGNHAWTGLHVQEQCMNAISARSNK